MLFNTLNFLIFMTVVFLLYWAVPHKFRWQVLLAANVYFYLSYDIKYLLILVLSTFVSYFVGIGLDRQQSQKKRKLLLAVGIGTPLLLLFVFKYLNFACYTVSKVLQLFAVPMQGSTLKLLMPVGISFYTFQMVGYLVDIYRGKITAERHLGKYAVFVSFFPNISSGPIERAGHFLPQLEQEKKFDYEAAVYGSRLLLWGLIKKIVFADQISKYVDVVFNNVPEHTGICFAIATFIYTFQIYFDFSGYSDMAIGLAKMLGFELPVNFKSPYWATSIKEFWGRWHISLSTWFRDYVYISLGGNRVSKFRRSLNLILTFLVSGLWHGASWTFVLWGGIHGTVQVIEKTVGEAWNKGRGTKTLVGKEKDKETVRMETEPKQTLQTQIVYCCKTTLRTLLTFCIVSYAWMFFRANSIADALYIAGHMFADFSVSSALMQLGMGYGSVVKVLAVIVCVMIFDYFNQKADVIAWLSKLPAIIRWIGYVGAAIIVLALCMHGGVSQQFIYFNF